MTFKRPPYLRYSAALLAMGVGFFAVSTFTTAYAIALGIVGLLFMLLALGVVLYNELR